MTTHSIAVISGDGIGPDVITEALKVMHAAAARFGFKIETTDYPLGAEHYLTTGEILPDQAVDQLRGHRAIMFGAIGDPRVPPGILERGFLLALRARLRHAVNLRPVRLYPGVASPIAGLTPERCDFAIVRENTEGLYVGAGGTVHWGTSDAVATETSINSARVITELVRYGFRLAQRRRQRLTLCHKKNVLVHAGGLWQDVVHAVAAEFPDVETGYVHVDALCQYLPISPERFDVIVTDNLFGDIVSDLAATLQGGLGTACSGNVNIDGTAPSMFEPVHGSAPDIAGRGLADPSAAVLSGALCLASIGEEQAAVAIEAAVATVLAETSTATARPGTAELGDRITDVLTTESATWNPGASSIMLAMPTIHGASAGPTTGQR